MEAFSRENTRNRIALISVLVTIIYLILHQPIVLGYVYDFSFGRLVAPTIVFIVMAIGFSWVVSNTRQESFFTTGIFPAFNTAIIAVFFELLISESGEVSQLIYIIYFAIGVFIVGNVSMLTSNVLHVSLQKSIPLGQAGMATSYILSLILQYFAFFVLFSSDINVFLRFIGIFVVVVYYTYFLLWVLEVNYKQLISSTFIISLIVLLFALILSVWALSVEIISLVLSVVLYVLLGVALEEKEKFPRHLWIEYTVLVVASLAILLISSEWGINGSFFL
jgi:hypothetical protein